MYEGKPPSDPRTALTTGCRHRPMTGATLLRWTRISGFENSGGRIFCACGRLIKPVSRREFLIRRLSCSPTYGGGGHSRWSPSAVQMGTRRRKRPPTRQLASLWPRRSAGKSVTSLPSTFWRKRGAAAWDRSCCPRPRVACRNKDAGRFFWRRLWIMLRPWRFTRSTSISW